MDAFSVLQIAVAVLMGNIMTRMLFRGWERYKLGRIDWGTTFFYLTPVGLIILVLIGSTG